MRLNPSAALDARVVNLYVLMFTANCTGERKDAQLFVQVNETKRLVCTHVGKNAAVSLIKLALAHSAKDKSALIMNIFT